VTAHLLHEGKVIGDMGVLGRSLNKLIIIYRVHIVGSYCRVQRMVGDGIADEMKEVGVILS
jgi:hypothetical protein